MTNERKVLNPEPEHTSSRHYFIPVLSVIVILVIQAFHFGVIHQVWTQKPPVDRANCRCGCWDTIFKGRYESPPGRYKHFYFNITINTLKIWVVTVAFIISLYETLKYLFRLIASRRLRCSMFLLFVSVFYSHYYSWWNFCNYYNDDFYSQWYHQMFFTVTELVSTLVVLNLCDLDVALNPRDLMVIMSIAVAHIWISGVDQFVENVILGNGRRSQIVRDIGLMIPDLLHVIIPLWLMFRLSREFGMSVKALIPRGLVVKCVVGIVASAMFVKLVL